MKKGLRDVDESRSPYFRSSSLWTSVSSVPLC